MADSFHRLQEATEDLLVLVPGRYRPVLFQGDFCISLYDFHRLSLGWAVQRLSQSTNHYAVTAEGVPYRLSLDKIYNQNVSATAANQPQAHRSYERPLPPSSADQRLRQPRRIAQAMT